MDAGLKAKWTHNLRSGKYTQARGDLKIDDGYCALGVLLDDVGYDVEGYIHGKPNEELGGSAYRVVADLTGSAAAVTHIPSLNDDRFWTFGQIADWIEKNIPVDEGEDEEVHEIEVSESVAA